MKIAVNTRFLIKNKLEGIGWFTYESLKRITTRHPEHEFYFFFDRAYDKEFLFAPNVHPVILYPPARHPFLWYYWFEISVPGALKKIKPDLFLSTDGYASLHASCKQVMVVHDLAFEHFRNHVSFLALKYYRHFAPLYARKADRIATVSEFTREDLISLYHIAPDKIDVTWNGSNELFQPLSAEEKEQAKKEFARGSDYFIYAGAIQPRKNIVNLFRAFDEFKSKGGSEMKLIIVGRNWNYEEAGQVHSQMKFKDDVIFYGHASRKELSQLMGGAFSLVYVSFFEGFGIPIVEAMSCGVPVITSNVSSMPEVAGDAALYVDPNSVSDIASKMLMMVRDEKLRERLIENGKTQRAKFSWQQTADRLWNCVMAAIDSN